jgi:hypothetical protein
VTGIYFGIRYVNRQNGQNACWDSSLKQEVWTDGEEGIQAAQLQSHFRFVNGKDQK